MAKSGRRAVHAQGPAAESPLLRALVARYLDPEAARAHVGACPRGGRVRPETGT